MNAPLKTVLIDIPGDQQGKRGWKVTLNGQEVREVTRLTVENPKFGILEYANDPAGYDRWGWHEIGGGGSVIVPYVRIAKEVYVGLLLQNRPNQGGKVLNVPRGFLQPGESHFQGAKREAAEELGADLPVQAEVLPLEGEPMNPNSAFFETYGTLADGSPEGVRCFGLELPPNAFEGEATGLRIKPGFLVPNPDLATKKLVEAILGCSFYPWDTAVLNGDMFTVAVVGRLLAHLKNR